MGGAAAAVPVLAVWLTGGLWQDNPAEGSQLTVAAARMGAPQQPATTSSTPSSSPTTSTTTTTKKSTTTTTPPPETSSSSSSTPEPTTTEPPATSEEADRSCSSELDGTLPHVAQVGHHVDGLFDIDSIGGRADRSGTSDHPSGLALDFMVDSGTGDEVAEYVLDNRDELGVKYVIWEQRYNDGDGWSTMEDRGGATANHFDHVHVSFEAGADVSVTC
jgi:hypothetical protein